jgi:chemotaxis protein methyltransferase CheR
LTPVDFAYLAERIKARSGISLGEDKIYLCEARLEPVATAHKLGSISKIVPALRSAPNSELLDDIVDAMTTNETLFFRDQGPFDLFEKRLLPQFAASRGRQTPIRIWSAAASTGQEAFSLAILISEARASLGDLKVEIIGTDLCRAALARAQSGRFNQFEIQRGLPRHICAKYFTHDGNDWVVSREIRNMVRFQRLNLMEDFRSLGRFDIVFCRNVLIYFDFATKRDVLARTAAVMADDGALILGASETVIGISEQFTMVDGARGLYVKTGKNPAGLPIATSFFPQARADSTALSSASRKT